MLSPTDAALLARDPAVPGLAVLLDDEAVSVLLGAPVHRNYLRYKPGTSCVLGGRIELPAGPADLFLTAYDVDGGVKIDKTVADAPRGAVLHVDRVQGLVAALATADRDLPFLAALADGRTRRKALRRLLPDWPGMESASVATLSYKPMRRWVGLLTPRDAAPVVVRAYRPGDAEAAAAVVGALATAPPRTPRLLGVDPVLGAMAVEYLDGRPLDALLAHDRGSAEQLFEVGRVLGQLHARRLAELPVRAVDDDIAAVRAAAGQVAVLLPDLGAAARTLAEELSRRLARLPADRSVVHGDFSTDQVVVGADGAVALLDLDRAVTGDPAADLASVWAASAATEVSEVLAAGCTTGRRDVTATLRAGYATVRPLPAEESVSTHAAALLLRRVVEPFRLCAPDWSDRSRVLLARAVAAVPGPLETAPDDLVTAVLGGPVSWEVLKDKPGRRRTSRAHSPGGTAIVKVYASRRAPVVATRVSALSEGPSEPALPRVLLCDQARHVVILSEVPGTPLRDALVAGDAGAAARVGRALARWHAAHRRRVPAALRPHTAGREIEILLERCAVAPPDVRELVRSAIPALQGDWPVDTVVHRDLYEDQVVLDRVVGLLDLDDAAAGPAELDLGNLSAHLELLARRTGGDLDVPLSALLDAYAAHAPLDAVLLARCRALSLLRLACVHADASLVPVPSDDERTLIVDSPAPHGHAEQ